MSDSLSSADRDARIAAGKWVKCSRCGGYGVHEIFEGIADCKQCNGGYVWEYPKGAHAAYPGGPFVAG